MNKVIMTGASGMIGSCLIDKLVNENIAVTAVVRKGSLKIDNITKSKSVEIIECNNDDILCLPQILKPHYDLFYHFGWEGVFGDTRNDAFLQEKNILNTLNAIKAAKLLNCKKFVIAGSQAEYGNKSEPLTCDTIPTPSTGYGIAKFTAFSLGKILASQLGLEICNGRVLSAYGIRDNSYTMICSTLLKLLQGKNCDFTTAEQVWDFVYADDVANAFYLIGKYGKNNKAYPIASGQSQKLKYYIETMHKIVGNNNAKLNFGAVELKAGTTVNLCADITELTKDTGFVPKVTFEEGIKNTINWLKHKEENE